MELAHADRMRRTISAFMTTTTAVCTFVAIGILLVILSYIAGKELGHSVFNFL